MKTENTLSNYRIIEKLFVTSHSIIYVVKNKTNNKKFIMKKILIDYLCDYDLVEELSNEFIIQYYDIFDDGAFLYILMEKYESDLFEILLDTQLLPLSKTKHLFCQLVLGLEYIHDNDIIHNDIKPENIFLKGENCVLADFGLSKQNKSKHDLHYDIIGTLEYASLELLQKNGFNYKNDIYSLGVVLAEMVLHKNLFGITREELNNDVLIELKETPIELPEEIPQEVKQLIHHMTHSDPDKRATIQEIKEYKWVKDIDWDNYSLSSKLTNSLTLCNPDSTVDLSEKA
jgi:serine/threonine protein kinase